MAGYEYSGARPSSETARAARIRRAARQVTSGLPLDLNDPDVCYLLNAWTNRNAWTREEYYLFREKVDGQELCAYPRCGSLTRYQHGFCDRHARLRPNQTGRGTGKKKRQG